MSAHPRQREAAVLQLVVPALEAEGFEVFLHPGAQFLPPFMRNYRPDAIALRPDRKIAIEVKAGGREDTNDTQLGEVRALFDGHAEWEFRVFYAPTLKPTAEIATESLTVIDESLSRLLTVYDQSGAIAALLTGWSVFEAAARRLMPAQLRTPQVPAQLLGVLASDGAITPDEAEFLRRIQRLRNEAAHGRLEFDLSREDLSHLIDVTRTLLQLSEPAQAEAP